VGEHAGRVEFQHAAVGAGSVADAVAVDGEFGGEPLCEVAGFGEGAPHLLGRMVEAAAHAQFGAAVGADEQVVVRGFSCGWSGMVSRWRSSRSRLPLHRARY